MDWPSKLTFGDIERIKQETGKIEGKKAFDALKLLECHEDQARLDERFNEYLRLMNDPMLCIAVLFWWKNGDLGEVEADDANEKIAAFRIAVGDPEEMHRGVLAFEEALGFFIQAMTRNKTFGAMMKKARVTGEVLSKEVEEQIANLPVPSLEDLSAESAGGSPAEQE